MPNCSTAAFFSFLFFFFFRNRLGCLSLYFVFYANKFNTFHSGHLKHETFMMKIIFKKKKNYEHHIILWDLNTNLGYIYSETSKNILKIKKQIWSLKMRRYFASFEDILLQSFEFWRMKCWEWKWKYWLSGVNMKCCYVVKKSEAVDGLKSGKCLGFPSAYCYIYPL